MKSYSFIFLVFVIGLLANPDAKSQETPTLGLETDHLCEEVALEFTELIPRFFQKGEIDSLHATMYEWDLQCGLAEPLLRIYILYQIATNSFSEDFFPDNIFDYLYDYQEITTFENPNFYLDYYSWEYEKIHPSFNLFTIGLARSLLVYEDLSPTERFFVEFYSNNFEVAWNKLNKRHLEGSRIGMLYHQMMKNNFRKAYKPFAWIMAGAWLPSGNLGIVGNHPQVGGGIGYHRNGFFTGLNIAVAFLQSRNEYEVTYLYQRHTVRGFTNFNISLTMGAVFSIERQPVMKLGFSFGYETIMAIAPSIAYQEPGRFINSLFIGPLMELRIPLSEKYHLGFYTRYNFLGFNNRPGTDLSGNAQWIGVKLGVSLYDRNRVGEFHL